MGAGCVAKERKEIESVMESGTESEITWTLFFLINQNVLKLQIILMSLSFKAEEKSKKSEIKKKSEDDLQRKQKQSTVILELTT